MSFNYNLKQVQWATASFTVDEIAMEFSNVIEFENAMNI